MADVPDFRPFETVIFDLDGTLIDTVPDIAAALNRLLAEEGRRRLDDDAVAAMLGDGAARLVERAFTATGTAIGAETGIMLTRRFLAFYTAEATERSQVYSGVPETLGVLRGAGLALGVCTNKPEAPSRRLLADLGLAGFFAGIVGGDSLDVKKPDGRHLLATLARIGARAETAVMVGDNTNDVTAARRAGVPIVAVSYGYTRTPPRELGADFLVDRFDAIVDALGRLALARRRGESLE